MSPWWRPRDRATRVSTGKASGCSRAIMYVPLTFPPELCRARARACNTAAVYPHGGSNGMMVDWPANHSRRNDNPDFYAALVRPRSLHRAERPPPSRGFLESLPSLNQRRVSGTELDVHLRVGDEVQVYCGLTRLVDIRRTEDGMVAVSANPAYRRQDCGRNLFGRWSPDRPEEFNRALDGYLDNVAVGRSNVAAEGAVQCLWSGVTEPWVCFDREAVLGYPPPGPRLDAEASVQLDSARRELRSRASREGWGDGPQVGNKLDRLAVDPDGRLVVLELKNSSAGPASVYYSPHQLLHYVWEWHSALETVRPQLQAVIDARVELGLTPPPVPRLTGGIRPAMGFGSDRRSPEVKRRYGEVLRIVNQHLPTEVSPIETWIIEEGTAAPVQLGGG